METTWGGGGNVAKFGGNAHMLTAIINQLEADSWQS